MHHVGSGRWLFDGKHETAESIFIQREFYQVLESVNDLGDCMKTDRQATKMSFTSKFC
jgi:hypothetical protein